MTEKPKWNIFFDMQGDGGVIEGAPNTSNPVPCVNMASLLAEMASNLPGDAMGIEVIGIRITKEAVK